VGGGWGGRVLRGGAGAVPCGPPPLGPGAHDSPRPERRKPDPQGRARAAQAAPPEPNKKSSFVGPGRAERTDPTKLIFLLGSLGGCRRRTLAAERSAPISRKSSGKRVFGVRRMGGYYDTPPWVT